MVTINAPLGVRVVVVDTGPLLNDVLRRSRQNHVTSLVRAAGTPSTRVYASAHIRPEVERHLARLAWQRGIAGATLASFWTAEYLPVIRFVDVPVDLESPSAKAVAARDPSDLPTALLAQLVAADAVLAEDNDLIATGFAFKGWLEACLALRDIAAFQGGLASTNFGFALLMSGASATAQAAARHPRAAALGGLLTFGLVGLAWLREWYPSRATMLRIGGELGRVLGDAFETHAQAQAVLQRWSLPRDALEHGLARVGRAVARAPSPVSAAAIERATGLPRAQVLDGLSSSAFVRTPTGWMLGRVGA